MNHPKNTLIIGASTKPERYSYKAIHMLLEHHHPVFAIGTKQEQLFGIDIHSDLVAFKDIDTITLYINPEIQKNYLDYMISLHPKRIIFNPGTENPSIYSTLQSHHIECLEACTLVLLSTNQF